MVNYACAFSQSELGKYFEWIIKLFNKLSKIYKKINTSDNSSQNSLIYFILVILTSSSWFHSNNSSGIFSGRVWKKIGDHLGSYLGWFWVSFWVGDHFGSCTNLKARPGATGELDVEFKFQRRCCKLSFLFSPCSQSSPESLLASYLELSLFQAPKCVFFFRVFPTIWEPGTGYLELEAVMRGGKNTSGHRTTPFRSRQSLLFCNYGQTISCQKGEWVREVS